MCDVELMINNIFWVLRWVDSREKCMIVLLKEQYEFFLVYIFEIIKGVFLFWLVKDRVESKVTPRCFH